MVAIARVRALPCKFDRLGERSLSRCLARDALRRVAHQGFAPSADTIHDARVTRHAVRRRSAETLKERGEGHSLYGILSALAVRAPHVLMYA